MSFWGKLRGQKKERKQDRPSQAVPPRVTSSMNGGFYLPGDRIGPYEIASRPLLGGMGIVYLCNDLEEGRPVALKTFRPEFLPDRAARDRFLREGTRWVEMGAHPHIVRCYHVFRTDAGDEVYLVLELVAKEPGHEDASLRAWLTPEVPLPIEQALLFALQMARGMQHAVETIPGFVHRDLKPENVLVGADTLPCGVALNRLRVTDFGLAAALETGGDQPSAAGHREGKDDLALGRTQLTYGIVGTPLYMAPEQWRGEPVTVATDVYALGCILYEMLAGQRAVEGNSLAALERGHCAGQVRPLPAAVAAEAREVVARCLAVEPRARYGNWAEVETALGAAYRAVVGPSVPAAVPAVALGHAEQVANGWSYSEIGASYIHLGKAEVAVSYFERAGAVGEAEGERPLAIAALTNLGSSYLRLGDAHRAIGYCEQALAIAREIGDRHGEGNPLSNLGLAYAALGDARRAIGYHEQALTIARESGDRRIEGTALGNLGLAYVRLGETRRAIGYHEQMLTIAREIGDHRWEGLGLMNLGNAYADLGDARRAIGYHEQQLAISREVGDRWGEGSGLTNLGNAYTDLGDPRRAIGYHEQALMVAREIGDRRVEELGLMNLGIAYLHLGDARRAINCFEQALAAAREVGDRRAEGQTLGNLGVACANLGNEHQAAGYWQRATVIFEEIGDVKNATLFGFNLAQLLVQQRRYAEALPYAQRAAQVFNQIGHAQYTHRAQQLLAQIQAALR